MTTFNRVALGLGLLSFLCLGADCSKETHDDAFTVEGLLTADASDLRKTVVTPHMEVSLRGQDNVLWCGGFQLAWNELCDLLGEDVRLDNEPAMVKVLNERSFTRQHLDPGSYVAVAGFVKDDVHGQIEKQLQDTFEGQATPRYIPQREITPRPQDIVAYSYLFKNLEFAKPFERIAEPIDFAGEQLPCFGIGEEYKSGRYEMLDQFLILDYQNADDFVIEFKTKSKRDKVILAKVEPKSTLKATVDAVTHLAATATSVRPESGDILKVPKFNFDVTRKYNELTGKRLIATSPDISPDLMVLSALQNIRFQFDEKGVRLRSESHTAFGCGGPSPAPPTKHVMIFDKPFLVILQRGRDKPYFVLWVSNPELFVK